MKQNPLIPIRIMYMPRWYSPGYSTNHTTHPAFNSLQQLIMVSRGSFSISSLRRGAQVRGHGYSHTALSRRTAGCAITDKRVRLKSPGTAKKCETPTSARRPARNLPTLWGAPEKAAEEWLAGAPSPCPTVCDGLDRTCVQGTGKGAGGYKVPGKSMEEEGRT